MTQHLSDQPQTEQPVNVPAFSGAILGLQGDVLHGWAIDNMYPDQRPAVEVFIDGASVALVRADQYEPNAPAGDQYNGFSVQLRQHWINSARLITAKIANQSLMLKGQLSLPAAPSEDSASISSQVWHTGGLRIGGWCWDPKAPNRHVAVTVREGACVIGQTLCNKHNQALAYRTTSDHGFLIDLPWELADGAVHVLDLLDDRGNTLTGSPISICCVPEGAEGLLLKLNPAHDQANVALLTQVIKDQSLRLPKSTGWKYYPEWFETFQKTESLEDPAIQCKVGLLLISAGDIELEKTSISSLGYDITSLHKRATATCGNVLIAVQELLNAGCERILPLTAGDRLAAGALPQLCALLDKGDAWAFTDCDHDGPNGERSNPWFKPAWDIDFFIGADIFSPGAIFGAGVVQQALTLLEGSGIYSTLDWQDLLAAIALATQKSEMSVLHLPKVLYHRSKNAPTSPELAETSDQRYRAVQWLCEQLVPNTKLSRVPGYPSLLRPHWALPRKLPKVSLIVPTRDQVKLLKTCIEGLLNKTDYPEIEIIIVDNNSSDPATLEYLSSLSAFGVKILPHPYPFNYSTINNRAVDIATGDLIGLVNNDIEIMESDWLLEMVSHIMRQGIGAVGAKLLWPNGMVQHGGVVVGINGLAAHSGNNLTDQEAGYLATNQITRRQQAVTAACLVMQRSIYNYLGGLDEKKFPVAFNDIDLCQRIQQLGLDIIWSASAKLIHAESASRGKDVSVEKRARAEMEQRSFIERWSSSGAKDIHYHPALSHDYLSGPYGGLSLPPLSKAVRRRPNRD